MTHVYILTITDGADFCRTKHHSVWASHDGARAKAQTVVDALIAEDTSGLGDTFDVDICQMEVNHAHT